MLKSALLAVAAAGLIVSQAGPASANAAMAGATKAPATERAVVDVRRGGFARGRVFRGGARHIGRRHIGRRHFGGGRHIGRRHWRPRRGIYFAAPYVVYRSHSYGSCNWLRRKAVRTGSRYWWRRYNSCRHNYW